MEKLKRNIEEMEFPPREYRIDRFTFSGCRTEDEFMQRSRKHAITLNKMIGIKSDNNMKKKSNAEKGSGKKPISNERLMTLREKGHTFQEIFDILEKEGHEDISLGTVRRRIIAICKLSGIEDPKYNQLYQKLRRLASYGWSNRKIQKYLEERGIYISINTIRKRIIKAIENGNQEKRMPRKAHAKLIEHLLKLKESKGATDEQIGIIAKTYGINMKDSRKPKQLVPDEELNLR